MSKRLDETLGTVGYDNLINGLYPPAEPFSVVIRKGSAETTYKRGTVLALSEGTAGDGKYVILGTAAVSNETLTLTACWPRTSPWEPLRRNSGSVPHRPLNSNALIMDAEHTFSAADKEALRGVGILISDAVEI